MERSICRKCNGEGTITRHRSRWIGGGRNGYRSEWTVSETCQACGGAAMIEIEGVAIDAPGFTAETFAAAVSRAKREQLRTNPGAGCVLVMSGSDDAQYAVTRQRCDCLGHMGHGHCKHRALCIYLHDVQGVDVLRVPTIGFSKGGVSLTTGRKPAAKAVA